MEGGKTLHLLAAGSLLLGVLGCGGGLVRSPGPSGEVLALRQRVNELQRQARVDEVRLARLQEEIAALEKELGTFRGSAARGSAARDAAARDAAAREPAPTVGDAEDLGEDAFPPFDPEIEETELEDSEMPPAAVPPAAVPPAAVPPAEVPPAEVPQPTAATPEALSLYDEGYTLFHQQRYDEAEERFRRYLELYPDTDLADNAQFWIGECRYARDDFAAALEAFTSTVELYPQGNKVADALLKAGKCLEVLGQSAAARQTYHEITDRFPSSSAAAVARERLEALP